MEVATIMDREEDCYLRAVAETLTEWNSPIEARGRSLVSPKHKDLVRRNRVLCVSEILCRDRDRD